MLLLWTQFVYPPFPRDFHSVFNFPADFSFSPCSQIHYQYTDLEGTRLSRTKSVWNYQVGREVICEVYVTAFRSSDDAVLDGCLPGKCKPYSRVTGDGNMLLTSRVKKRRLSDHCILVLQHIYRDEDCKTYTLAEDWSTKVGRNVMRKKEC